MPSSWSRAPRQREQDVELERRELHVAPVDAHAPPGGIDGEGRDAERLRAQRGVEKALVGAKPDEGVYAAAAKAAMNPAKAQKHNRFKIQLAKQVIVRALTTVGSMEQKG